MMNKKVIAIQGIKGSFHHQVAESYFGDEIELLECMNFSDMPDTLLSGLADYAVMAIENSIAGTILPNYALLDEADLDVCGEFYLSIEQNLMALKGQKIEDIQSVHSHPMALLQCRKFFKAYPHIELVEEKDTAEVAKRIRDNELKGIAAIASHKAADTYGLDILAEGIQTIKQNATRFVIVRKPNGYKLEGSSKATVKFTLKHEIGSLGNILNGLAKHQVNLSKIQSLPIIEKPWEYAFFADLVYEDIQHYKNAIIELTAQVSSLKILGVYKKNRNV